MARRRPKRKDEFYSAAGAKKLLAEAGDDPYTLRNRFGMLDGFMFKFEGLALVDDIKRGIEDTEGFLHGKYVVRGIIPWFGFDKHVDRYSFPNVNGAIQAIVDQYEYPNHPTPSCVKETQISFQHGPDICVDERVSLFRRDAVVDFLGLFEHLELDPLIQLQQHESDSYTFHGWYNVDGAHKSYFADREKDTGAQTPS